MSYTEINHEDSFEKIEAGINKLCNIVKTTLGPAGRTVAIQREFGPPLFTKDGVTVAMSIQLSNPVEDMGAQLVKEVSILSNKQTGDGTTTASVIAQALVHFSFELIKKQEIQNVNTFRKGMLQAMNDTVEILKAKSKQITNDEEGLKDFRKIAMISSNNDTEVADLIMESIKIMGDAGAIKVDIGNSHQSFVKSIAGMTYANGMVSAYFATDREKGEWRFNDCFILATDFKISTLFDIQNVLMYVGEQKSRPLLIICDDIEETPLRLLFTNIANGNLKCCVVKAPGFGSQKTERLQDIATMTGGVALLKDKMNTLKMINDYEDDKIESILGRAGNVIVKKNEFSLLDCGGDAKEIEKHKKFVKAQIKAEEDPHLKDQHAERLAKMTDGVALIYVGAESEVAAKEKKDRVDDSVMAVKSAADGGFLSGGGLTLYGISFNKMKSDIDGFSALKDQGVLTDFEKGEAVFYKAIKAPMMQILSNAYMLDAMDDIDSFIANTENFTKGIDLFEGGFINYLENGILDPSKVTISAVKNAVSICSTLITMSGVIYMKSANLSVTEE